jgi:hypothetical protein
MATVYQIKHTDGFRTITIQPGTLNGPGGVLTDTDLHLYGRGTLDWGAGVDQNQLRLTENFACPESITTPGQPMDSNEIGVIGSGVNNPIEGQQWFNTTDKNVYAFGSGVWKLVGGVTTGPTAPVGGIIGDLWYDTTAVQLKVFNGVSFVSVAAKYLLLTGGSLTSGSDITLSGGGEIFGLPTVPTTAGSASSKQYVDDQISLVTGGATLDFVNTTGDTMTGDLNIFNTSPQLKLNVSNTAGDASFLFQENGSNRGDLLFNQPSDEISLRKLTGGTTNNTITLTNTFIQTHATNGKIRTPATIGADVSTTVTTKGYVDTEIAAVSGGGGPVTGAEIFEQVSDPGGAAKNGDIWLDTDDVPSIYIKMNGIMRKIFPAQYTV